DKLDIKYKTKEKIKKEYNKKNSKTVKKIDKDTNEAKKHKVKTVPSVFINGEKVKDPHDYKEYKKLMKD
ncbi:thioredoxin domain-containing protein, partial [Staphylococcus arlettae]|uniref:thioredoxin domain-containing protein n=1 Tax=Staphylococcus arlettae TaxID=29378 RepID=UPI000D41387E